jgi:hypothetical protein
VIVPVNGGGLADAVFVVNRRRGIRTGSRLTATIVMSAGGITLTRRAKMKAA